MLYYIQTERLIIIIRILLINNEFLQIDSHLTLFAESKWHYRNISLNLANPRSEVILNAATQMIILHFCSTAISQIGFFCRPIVIFQIACFFYLNHSTSKKLSPTVRRYKFALKGHLHLFVSCNLLWSQIINNFTSSWTLQETQVCRCIKLLD